MIRYHTNWMGPMNQDWIKRHGDHWCIGRIDIYGTNDDYSPELDLPMMHADDWYTFTQWLHDFTSQSVCTLDELVQDYEKTNSKIRWFKEC